jgi:hypothetical protein
VSRPSARACDFGARCARPKPHKGSLKQNRPRRRPPGVFPSPRWHPSLKQGSCRNCASPVSSN